MKKLHVFLENSYYLIYNFDGILEDIRKLKTKINSQPILINNSIFYILIRAINSVVD